LGILPNFSLKKIGFCTYVGTKIVKALFTLVVFTGKEVFQKGGKRGGHNWGYTLIFLVSLTVYVSLPPENCIPLGLS
jgi:hypothetical protein